MNRIVYCLFFLLFISLNFRYTSAQSTYSAMKSVRVSAEVFDNPPKIVLSWPSHPDAVSYNATNIKCYGGSDGIIDVDVSGGVNPYAYLWNDPAQQTTPSAAGLCSGWYTLTVIDSNGCIAYDSVYVENQSGVNISGQVYYDNNLGTPMPGVIIDLTEIGGSVQSSDTTDITGSYLFNDVQQGNYTLIPNTSKAWGGVNSTDALAIMQHFVGINFLNGIRLKAADVNTTAYINSISVAAVSLQIFYPEDVLEITGVRINGESNSNLLYKAGKGRLNISWYDLVSMELYAGQTLFYIKFHSKLMTKLLDFKVSDDGEFAGPDAKPIRDVEVSLPYLKIIQGKFPEIIISSVSPNPFSEYTRIEFEITQPGSIECSIYDVNGKCISASFFRLHSEAGSYNIVVKGSELAPGLNFYKIIYSSKNIKKIKLLRLIVNK